MTTPLIIEKKIQGLTSNQYGPMDYSSIFKSLTNFTDLNNKFVDYKTNNEKKVKKKIKTIISTRLVFSLKIICKQVKIISLYKKKIYSTIEYIYCSFYLSL